MSDASDLELKVSRAIGESLGHTHFATKRYVPEARAAIAATDLTKLKAVAGQMERALADCLEQAEGCAANHYGDNPEGGEGAHIANARAALLSCRALKG